MKRLLRFRNVSFGRLLLFLCLIICFAWALRFDSTPSALEQGLRAHRSKIYDVSNPFVMINLIDQFLDTTDANERDALWPILIRGWSHSFQFFVKRSEALCSSSSPSSVDFIRHYLDHYTQTILTDNLLVQRHLTGFGLFFDYNPRQMRTKNQHLAYELQLSECPYFDLIVLLMKTQLVLHRAKIPYFLSRNSLIGAIRHHDIIPWISVVALNLPEKDRNSLIEQIPNQFDLVMESVNDSSVDPSEIGSMYKMMTKEKPWPYVELFFYRENETDIFGPIVQDESLIHLGRVKKSDVYPVHLRPFGPLLLQSMNNPSAVISKEQLNVCEIHLWNHQSARLVGRNQQWRMPCEQLAGTFEIVRSTKSWRQGFCQETLKSKHRPYRTHSYFRYVSYENRTSLFR